MKSSLTEQRAEMLAAMDCMMHHLTDSDDLEQWMSQAMGRTLDWHILRSDSGKRRTQYEKMVRKMNGNEWECMVHTFASIVSSQCFQRTYRPGAFSELESKTKKLPEDDETGYCANCEHCRGVDDKRDVCKCALKNPHADWRYENNEPCPDWELSGAFK